MYDPAFPSESDLFCIGPRSTVSNWVCLIRIGNSFGIPFLQHSGYSHKTPTPCTCSDPKIGRSTQCNSFDFLFGVLVYDHTKNPQATKGFKTSQKPFIPILELYFSKGVDPITLNEKAFYPAWLRY